MHTDGRFTDAARNVYAKAKEVGYAVKKTTKEAAYLGKAVTREVANAVIAESTGRLDWFPGDTKEEQLSNKHDQSEAHKSAYFDRRAEEAKKVEENPVETVKSNNPYLVMKLA